MSMTKKEMEEMIAKLEAENAELKKAPEAPKKTASKKSHDEMVSMFIPLVDGEESEVVAGCNGVMYKIKRGVQVEVPHKIAVILQNSNKQAVRAAEYSASVKNQELNA